MESVRVRLVFQDRYTLNKSQRSLGLNRSWLLVKPQQFPTFSDLSAHLLHIFDLAQSCPDGLLLCMDDFVLPPFESTSILNDKDIISVKRKGGTSDKILKIRNTVDSLEDFENVEEQPLDAGGPPNKKESGGCEIESEEDAVGSDDTEPSENLSLGNALHKERKSKASTELQSSKQKKHRVLFTNGIEKDNQIESSGGQGLISEKVSCKKREKASVSKCKQIIEPAQQCVQKSSSHSKLTSEEKSMSSDQLQEKDKRTEDISYVTNTNGKVPSRSARRKKAKRQWLRAMGNIGKKKIVCKSKLPLKKKQIRAEAEKKEIIDQSKGLLHLKQSEQDEPENKIIQEQPNEKSDGEDEFVPVVIRPGHIRFEPLEEGEVVEQNQVSTETFPWNGITSKRKGQKWGTEKISSVERHEHQNFDHDQPNISSTTTTEITVNDPIDCDKLLPLPDLPKETFLWNGITSKKKGQKWSTEKISSVERHEHQNFDHDQPNISTTTTEIPVNDPIDFDKLLPLPDLPKEGDVIAYRILELSSTWTPEISSFRVGSVLWYKPDSRAVMLMPVPEYPVIPEKLNEDASESQPDNSIYKEDGSLEIDFSSLIDVRIVKHGNSDSSKTVANYTNSDSSKAIADKVTNSAPTNTDSVSVSPKAGNGEVNLLDHFTEALNAKKAQLYEENSWIKGSPVKSSWSYRALRGSALGPVMAILRSNNDI